VVAARRARAKSMRATPASADSISAFALASIHDVTSVSAGPPSGGLYLNPPLSGGLWEGVIKMPSASPAVRPWL